MKEDEKHTLKRVYRCANKKCPESCMYCTYRDNAAQMVLDFILMDMHTFHKNNGKMLGSWDVKDILVKTYNKLREMEKEIKDKDDV